MFPQLIDEAFERDLQQAMLASRVDYERAATADPPPEQAGANGHPEPPPPGQGKVKAKKGRANVLSVDQLQTLSNSQVRLGMVVLRWAYSWVR